MRTIDFTSRYRRDFRRVASGPLGVRLRADLPRILHLLRTDQPLDRRYSDHALTGEWHDHRDCHVFPDLVLIYAKIGPDVLRLVRLASHSELDF